MKMPLSKLILCSSNKTNYYNHDNRSWSEGPELIVPRLKFAAGLVTDEATHEISVVVTGGKYGNYIYESTEILIGDVWSIGNKE